MMKKMRLGVVASTASSVLKVLAMDMDIPTAFRMGPLVEALKTHTQSYNDLRWKLVSKYGKIEGEKGTIPPEKLRDFNDELNRLLDEEVEITVPEFRISALGDVRLSAFDVKNLVEFFGPEVMNG